MHQALACELIKKHVLKFETRIHTKVRSKGLAGEFVTVDKELIVTDINDTNGLGCAPREPNIIYPFNVSDIRLLEGMALDRLASVYELNEDGTPKKQGKKPGRKPKGKA